MTCSPKTECLRIDVVKRFYIYIFTIKSQLCRARGQFFLSCTVTWNCYTSVQRLRWSRGIVLAFSTQVREFAPGRSRRIFRAKKILSAPSFGGEVKPSVPCRSFTVCKRSIIVTCKSAFRQNYQTFLAHSSIFHRWVLSRGDTRGDAWWRKLERLTQIAQ